MPDYSQFTLFVFRSRNRICMPCFPQSTVCTSNIKNKIPSSIKNQISFYVLQYTHRYFLVFPMNFIFFFCLSYESSGTAVAQWLRCCATNL